MTMSLEQRMTTFPGLISDHDVLYETQMLGTMISAILYGIVIMLTADCLILLLKKDAAVESRRLQRFLVFFVVSLFLLSTLSLIQGMLISATSIFRGHSFPSLPGGTPFALPFSIWISDGFMVSDSFHMRYFMFIADRVDLLAMAVCNIVPGNNTAFSSYTTFVHFFSLACGLR